MAELSNEQLLVSRAGTVLDAGDVRLVAPLEGAAAYAPDEEIADYGAKNGASLVAPGEGVELSDPALEDYALIDLNSGLAYSTQAGWQLVDHPGDEVDLEDAAVVANLAANSSLGAPAAPSSYEQLQALPFESVVSY